MVFGYNMAKDVWVKRILLLIACLFSITGCVKKEDVKEERPEKKNYESKSLTCHMDENNIRATVNIDFNDKDETESASFIVKTSLKDMYGDVEITEQMKEDLIWDLAIEFNEIYNVEYIDSSVNGDIVEIIFSPYQDGEYTMFLEADGSIDGYKLLLNELDFEGFICEKNGIKDVTITDTITCSGTIGELNEEFQFDFNQNKDLLRAYIVAKYKSEEELEDGIITQQEAEEIFEDNLLFSGPSRAYIFNNEITIIASVYDVYYGLLKLYPKDDDFYTKFTKYLEIGNFVCQ